MDVSENIAGIALRPTVLRYGEFSQIMRMELQLELQIMEMWLIVLDLQIMRMEIAMEPELQIMAMGLIELDLQIMQMELQLELQLMGM